MRPVRVGRACGTDRRWGRQRMAEPKPRFNEGPGRELGVILAPIITVFGVKNDARSDSISPRKQREETGVINFAFMKKGETPTLKGPFTAITTDTAEARTSLRSRWTRKWENPEW